jgi:hypothetical protein
MVIVARTVCCDPLVDRWLACTGRCAVAQVLSLAHCGDNVVAPKPSHGPPIPCLAASSNSNELVTRASCKPEVSWVSARCICWCAVQSTMDL